MRRICRIRADGPPFHNFLVDRRRRVNDATPVRHRQGTGLPFPGLDFSCVSWLTNSSAGAGAIWVAPAAAETRNRDIRQPTPFRYARIEGIALAATTANGAQTARAVRDEALVADGKSLLPVCNSTDN
jgi:hypothetical protein